MPKLKFAPLPEVLLITPELYEDSRGLFKELYNSEKYYFIHPNKFVQDNLSVSYKNVLRGLHTQLEKTQGKLVFVTHGEVFDVAVDLRLGSPRFGEYTSAILSETNHNQLYIPPGFAHGFVVLSDVAVFQYKCTDFYHPESSVTVKWDDPEIGIFWPVDNPILDDKDSQGISLSEFKSCVI